MATAVQRQYPQQTPPTPQDGWNHEGQIALMKASPEEKTRRLYIWLMCAPAILIALTFPLLAWLAPHEVAAAFTWFILTRL